VSIPRVSESPPPPQLMKPKIVEEPKVMIKEEPVRIAMKKTMFSLKKPLEKKKIAPRSLGFGEDSDDEGGLGVKAHELVKEEPHAKAPAMKQPSPIVAPAPAPAPAPVPAPTAPTPATDEQKDVSPATADPQPAAAQPAMDPETYKKQLEEYYKQYGQNYANQYASYPATSSSTATTEEQLKAYAASGIPIGLQYPVSQVTVEVGKDLKSLGLIPRLQSSGGPCNYSVHPTLPPGIKIDPTTGELHGTPTEVSGTVAVNVYAANAWGTAVTSIMVTIVDSADDDMDGPDDADMGISKPKKVYRTKLEAIEDFEQMLRELNCSISETWHEAQLRLKKDERFYALHMMAERRRVWQRYIKDLDSAAPAQPAMPDPTPQVQNPMFQAQTYPPTNPEEAFLQLLRERLSTRKEVFDENPLQFIVNDARFNGISPDRRQPLIKKHLEKQRKLLNMQAQYDMATKRSALVKLLTELSLDTPTPLFHTKTPFAELKEMPKFARDRRKVLPLTHRIIPPNKSNTPALSITICVCSARFIHFCP